MCILELLVALELAREGKVGRKLLPELIISVEAKKVLSSGMAHFVNSIWR